MHYIAKLIGFFVKQKFDEEEQRYPVFSDYNGIYYFNSNGERIACLESEVTI